MKTLYKEESFITSQFYASPQRGLSIREVLNSLSTTGSSSIKYHLDQVRQGKHQAHRTVWSHTRKAVEIADAFTTYFPSTDRACIKIAAELHDVGKLWTHNGASEEATFHKHEVYSASVVHGVFRVLKQEMKLAHLTVEVSKKRVCLELNSENVNKIRKLVRYHMWRFDKNSSTDTYQRFLMKIGRGVWDPLYTLRLIDRAANYSKAGFPIETKQMIAARKKMLELLQSGEVLFEQDINYPLSLVNRDVRKKVLPNLLPLLRSHPERNNPSWIGKHLKKQGLA